MVLFLRLGENLDRVSPTCQAQLLDHVLALDHRRPRLPVEGPASVGLLAGGERVEVAVDDLVAPHGAAWQPRVGGEVERRVDLPGRIRVERGEPRIDQPRADLRQRGLRALYTAPIKLTTAATPVAP